MITNIPKIIIVHHTATSRAAAPKQFFAVNAYHRDTKDTDGNFLYHFGEPSSLGYYGGYHIFIEPDGTELRYREDWEQGAHTKGQNLNSLAVCMAGNFDVELPTEAQIKTLVKRIKEWQKKYNISNTQFFNVPHRKFSPKSCYGKLLADNWSVAIIEPQKAPEDIEKEKQITDLTSLLDSLSALLLKIKIFLDLQTRQKQPPK